MFFRRIAPQSLFGRFLLIIVIPALLVQLVAIYIFYERHWSSMGRNMSASLAADIAYVVQELEDSDPEDYPHLFHDVEKYLNLNLYFRTLENFPKDSAQDNTRYQLLKQELGRFMDYPISISTNEKNQKILVHIGLPYGILAMEASHKRLANPTTYIFTLWVTGAALVLLIVAIMFLRNQVRSITRLAKAADRFGKGQKIKHFKPQGAREVRQAGVAFIEMKKRIKRLLDRRAQMLAGVSHDLRTPLTRMKLQLEMIEDKEAAKELRADIQEMESMIEGYLDFAKGSKEEETQEIPLKSLLDDILNDYRHHQSEMTVNTNDNPTLTLRYKGFKRCLCNLIDNALAYGTKVTISVEQKKQSGLIHIEDNGPGIPEDKRDEVFQPFFRLESSRNRETGGTGLGLSIARDVVHIHGGDIMLGDSDLGGLKVTIRLPA